MTVNLPFFFKPLEDRRAGPRAAVNAALNAFRKHTGHVFNQAAAGDVGHALNLHLLHDREHLLDVDAGGFYRTVGKGRTVKGHRPVGSSNFHDLAQQREAVAVRAA